MTLPRPGLPTTTLPFLRLAPLALALASCAVQDDPLPPPEESEPDGQMKTKDAGGWNGSYDYCDGATPCASGEGDCDLDTQCDVGLSCVTDLGANFGFAWTVDMCAPAHCADDALSGDETSIDFGGACGSTCGGVPNSFNYCHPGCECADGVGDCTTDADCQSGLVCGVNNGAQYGLQWTLDVCTPSTCTNGVQDGGETAVDFGGPCGGTCSGANGDEEGFCTAGCPCALGEGDCDLDSECQAGLYCVPDRGADYGLDALDDLCLPATAITDTLAGDLVITEIMSNPNAVIDSRGEYFELYNPTNNPINLNGMLVKDGGAQSFTVGTDVVIKQKGYSLFAKNGSTAINGGLVADYDYADVFVLLGSDSIILEDGTGFQVDKVTYNLTWPQPVGKSIELSNTQKDAVQNDVNTSWCESVFAISGGDKGSPGYQNRICP